MRFVLASERALAQQLRAAPSKMNTRLLGTSVVQPLGLKVAVGTTRLLSLSHRPSRTLGHSLAPATSAARSATYSTAAPQRDPREKDLAIPNKAVKAIFDQSGGPCRMVTYDPSQVQLKEGEVLVRITYTGVCHTYVHRHRL